MKILLIGRPRSGKTTLLANFIREVDHKQGFVAQEVCLDGERVGFDLVAANGVRAVLARTAMESTFRVGRYGVDVGALDGFIDSLEDPRPDDLLYIDEIGQMEVGSQKLKRLVKQYLDLPNVFVGTSSTAYSDDYIEEVLRCPDVAVIEVTAANREKLAKAFSGLASNLLRFNSLESQHQLGVEKLAKEYASGNQVNQLQKLFANTILYLAEGRVNKINDQVYQVQGNSGLHVVKKAKAEWVCDCDLFNGRGQFTDQAGECSHIQSIKVSNMP